MREDIKTFGIEPGKKESIYFTKLFTSSSRETTLSYIT